ncbi:hypothetical protein DYB30_005524 [Aphanomyces astaci]|uniref:UBR-type domain-containing protein n=1 Tax=Aphanomyces astaci TaxID=112090 RepID=A0A397CFJ9_APHAT|nr:hypothetical protein DYB30_005524 [Aphanomyces astaci]RHY65453.1 hypothetical protein DYB34_000309 [Aphanomyces astaci]RHZ05821.1 hypothetical protein DYB31_001721 [Aphanomyces astaci]
MATADEVEVTLEEVLQEDNELIDTADAVLGNASATHCSFPDGYIRQALFACLTCKTDEPAGLCLCAACMATYASSACEFLLDAADSLMAYEASHESTSGQDASEQAFQTGLSHEQQVEMAIGYDHMASALKEYLAGFAASGQTVKAEDIQGFFETLRASKRQRRE